MSVALPRPSLKPPSVLQLALRAFQRDFRAGELRLLLVAVALAVAALTAVAFFADRLNAGLARDARALLGGDAVLSTDRPAPAAVVAHAESLGLNTATSASFPSMARAPDARGGASRLVSVKAVSASYPLRGELQLQERPLAPAVPRAAAPQAGTVWVDAAVLTALQLNMGDPLLLGDATLKIAQIIAVEPDRGAGFLGFAPRVMLNQVDLSATGLVQPASRVTWRLAVAAPEGKTAALQQWRERVEAEIRQSTLRGARLETLEGGRPEMRQTLDRAEKFLNLVALLAALLAAVAVGIAARDFAQRHLDASAMLRVLGQPQRRIAWAYGLEFTAVGVLGSGVGVALGWSVHHVFVWLLAGLVGVGLPSASLWPVFFGLGVGMTLLLGFGLPPVLQLARVPALRVLRRDLGEIKTSSALVMGAGALGFGGLLLAVSSDVRLGLIAVGGVAVALAIFAALTALAVYTLKRVVPEAGAPRWLLLATRQLAARPALAVVQVSALSVGMLALVLLVLLRSDLIDSWKRATPADAPNRFVINLQPEQEGDFRAALQHVGVRKLDWYPMIRGRLVAVNGREVSAQSYSDDRAQRLVEREFNLSHAAQAPEHNRIVAGAWKAEERGGLSVEEGLAKTLGLKLGDTLRFDIAGQFQEGRITSLRKVDWGSMRVNFFVMFTVSKMPDVPLSYISAFRAPVRQTLANQGSKGFEGAQSSQGEPAPDFDAALSRAFPNITNVDVTASIAQVQGVLDQVIRAIEFLFAFTLAAGLVVLFAAVTATRESRAREYALMRALGASAQLLRSVQRTELLGVGALAGLLASGAAVAVGWALARYAFQFDWNPTPWVPLLGMLAGSALAWAAGWWGLREVLRQPVVQTLRRATVE
ncbi:MAG: hypothetical protein RI949_966 [Pseudomonadota bacterium]